MVHFKLDCNQRFINISIEQFPYFGNEESDLEDIDVFYATWEAFSSKRSFGWADKYRLSEVRFFSLEILLFKNQNHVHNQ